MSYYGIIGSPSDKQVASVRCCLQERGIDPITLDLSDFPASRTLSLLDGLPLSAGSEIEQVRSWYLRSIPLPLPFFTDAGDAATVLPTDLDHQRREAYARGRERRSFAFSFLNALQRGGARLINPPVSFTQHFLKLEQLQALRQAHIPLPRTLATNDPQAVIKFARTINGPIVYKPLAGGALCRRVTDEDLRPNRLGLLAHAPVMFQEEITGTNIRVYVVGGEIVASYEISSDELDYRGAETAVFPTSLSSQEHHACQIAARVCAMSFTGIDIRRRDDGSFALLECNPSPMFAGIEHRTRSSTVTRALTQLLLQQEPAAYPDTLSTEKNPADAGKILNT